MTIHDKVLFLIGAFLAGSMDMAIGNVIAYSMIKIFQPEEKPIFIYLFAVIFSLLPDIDALLQSISRDKILSDHRHLPHYPLLMIPLTFIIINFFSAFYAFLAILCLFSHYIHDSLDLEENGDGIKWLAPFNNSQYQICVKKTNTETFITEISKEKIKKIKTKKESMYRWMKKYYLKITENSLSGIIALTISLLMIFVL